MKIVVLTIISLVFSLCSLAQVQRIVDQFAGEQGLENAAISFMAYNIDKDSVLAVYNPSMAIIPASTTKLFSTALALETVGKDFKPKTEIYYQGEIDSLGVLHGNIIIRALGDPSLGSRFFYEKENKDDFLEEWIQAINNLGIKEINGYVISDGSSFGYHGVPDGWTWSDMGNYYGTGPSGAAVYDNTTFLHFSTSNGLNAPTKIDSMTPPIPGLIIDNKVTTYNANGDNAYVYGTPFSFERFVIGNLPRSRSNFEVKASVPDPELLLAQVFQDALAKSGVFIEKQAVGLRKILQGNHEELSPEIIDYNGLSLALSYEGRSIQKVVNWTNLRSVNFFAEQLMHISSYEKTGKGDYKSSIEFNNRFWENRLGMKLFQTDGSGLSRNNAISAKHFVELLKYMYKSKNFEDFENSLPIAGQSGTIRSLCRGQAADGRMKAKSGTLNRVKAYSGYVNSRSGDKIAFAIIVNNYDLTGYQAGKRMEKIFNAMANQ